MTTKIEAALAVAEALLVADEEESSDRSMAVLSAATKVYASLRTEPPSELEVLRDAVCNASLAYERAFDDRNAEEAWLKAVVALAAAIARGVK